MFLTETGNPGTDYFVASAKNGIWDSITLPLLINQRIPEGEISFPRVQNVMEN